MAKDTSIYDDLDLREEGKRNPADQEVRFSLDGVQYRIDLTTANAKQMREDFARYVAAARPVRNNQGRSTRQVNRAIRRWAAKQPDLEPLEPYGRVPVSVREAYWKAHPKD